MVASGVNVLVTTIFPYGIGNKTVYIECLEVMNYLGINLWTRELTCVFVSASVWKLLYATRFENCYFDTSSCIPRLRLGYANSTLVKITVFKPCFLQQFSNLGAYKHTCEFGSYHKLIPHVIHYLRRIQCNLLFFSFNILLLNVT